MKTETFNLSNPARPTLPKDPHAVLDYSWDWQEWLTDIGDTIVSAVVTATGGLTVVTVQIADGLVTAWASGGTVGKTATLTCRVTTVGGRVEDRTLYLQIRDR